VRKLAVGRAVSSVRATTKLTVGLSLGSTEFGMVRYTESGERDSPKRGVA